MIGEICAEIKNYFTYEEDKHINDYVISGGQISPVVAFPTDYIRIVGSRLNDGVHKVSDLVENPLNDESFHGAIWIMCPPDDFLSLVEEIEAWQEKNGGTDSAAMSPFQSESFGGYSYSKASGGNAESGGSSVPTWASVYASRLNRFRRIRT
jgi:hypothetical protein